MFKSERGAIEVSGTILAMFVAVILITVPILLYLATTQNNLEQMEVQAKLEEFMNEFANTGKISDEGYQKFVENLNGSNTYEVEIEIKRLDENLGKKTIQINSETIGEATNSYTTEYWSQLLQDLDIYGEIKANEGDIATGTVSLTSQPMSTQLTGVDTDIAATFTVTINNTAK